MSNSDKPTFEQAASRVAAIVGTCGIRSAQLADGAKAIATYSTLYDRLEKIVSANNMSYEDAIELLAIVAPLCNLLTPEGAKKELNGIVDFFIKRERL